MHVQSHKLQLIPSYIKDLIIMINPCDQQIFLINAIYIINMSEIIIMIDVLEDVLRKINVVVKLDSIVKLAMQTMTKESSCVHGSNSLRNETRPATLT